MTVGSSGRAPEDQRMLVAADKLLYSKGFHREVEKPARVWDFTAANPLLRHITHFGDLYLKAVWTPTLEVNT
jgi:hypothetical protein